MIIAKYTKQKMEVLQQTQSDLYKSIMIDFSDEILSLPPDEIRGRIAGFGIELVLKSGGNDSIFQDEFDSFVPSEDFSIE